MFDPPVSVPEFSVLGSFALDFLVPGSFVPGSFARDEDGLVDDRGFVDLDGVDGAEGEEGADGGWAEGRLGIPAPPLGDGKEGGLGTEGPLDAQLTKDVAIMALRPQRIRELLFSKRVVRLVDILGPFEGVSQRTFLDDSPEPAKLMVPQEETRSVQ